MDQFQQPHLTVPVIKASFPETILAKLLSPEQFNIIQFIDGHSTVADLPGRLGLSLDLVVLELRKLMALEVVGIQQAPPASLEALSKQEALDLLDAACGIPVHEPAEQDLGTDTVIVGKILDHQGAVVDARHPSFAPPSRMSQASMDAMNEIDQLTNQEHGWTPHPKEVEQSIEISTGWTEHEVEMSPPQSTTETPSIPKAPESSAGMAWPRSSAWHDAVEHIPSSDGLGPAHPANGTVQNPWNTSDFQSLSYGGYSYEPEPLDAQAQSSWSSASNPAAASHSRASWSQHEVSGAVYTDLTSSGYGVEEDLSTRHSAPAIESSDDAEQPSEALKDSVEREPWHRRWLFMDAASRVALPSAGNWKKHIPSDSDPEVDPSSKK